MKTIYMWINDFVENKEEIEQQLFFENKKEKKFKLVLLATEEDVVLSLGILNRM
jgi:hypothetical protein